MSRQIDHTNRVGNTPLHTAVLANDRSSVEALIALGADLTHLNMAGYNPFRMAVLFNRAQVIDVLHKASSPQHTAAASTQRLPSGNTAPIIPTVPSIVVHVRNEQRQIERQREMQHSQQARRERAHTLNVSQHLDEVPPPVPPREKKKVVYSRSISASNVRDDPTRNRVLPLPPFDLPSRMSQRAQEM